jgi:hypothetical protein
MKQTVALVDRRILQSANFGIMWTKLERISVDNQLRVAAICLLQIISGTVYAAPPKISGQPPMIKVSREGVSPYWLQVFDVAISDVVMKPMTISVAHYSWVGVPLPNGPVTVVVECDIVSANELTHCGNRSSGVYDKALMGVASSQLLKRAPQFLTVPPLNSKQWKFIWQPGDLFGPQKDRLIRVARFQYQIDPAQFRKIDPSLGPLVAAKNKPTMKWQGRPDVQFVLYPPKAVKEGKQGRYSMQCQVQSDLSVICGNASFDPPENLPYFTDVTRRWPNEWLSDAKLPDGRDARGVIFTREYNFSINKEEETLSSNEVKPQ